MSNHSKDPAINGGARSQTTADDVLAHVDLRGKRILVTGISSGTGMETARALLKCGATVLGTVRDAAKASQTKAAIALHTGELVLVELDLSSLASVRACADRLIADGLPLDAVICNAGIMATPFGRTQDGFEMQFGTNHLGHFLLVNRIASLLRPGSRVVVLSSNGHRGSDVDLDDPNFEHAAYDPWRAYERSKTANVLFTIEFDRRHKGRGVRACAVMPGTAETALFRHLTPEAREAVLEKIASDREKSGVPALEFKSVEQMAATSVWGAVVADSALIGGRYLENCAVAEIDDVPGIRDGVMSYALDPDNARRLWAKSEDLVGERFDAPPRAGDARQEGIEP